MSNHSKKLYMKMVLSLERWLGKVAIVTGASSGIGACIAETLAQLGLKVVGIARRVELIQEMVLNVKNPQGQLYDLKADITKEEEILDAFQWVKDNVGPVHILVNCAGISKETTLSDGDTADFKNVFDVNVLGLCITTREAIKSMKENNINGHIVHINSTLGHQIRNAASAVNVYPASKFAVRALTETLRQELSAVGSGIKVTSISPGLVPTEMTLFHKGMSQKKREILESRTMLKVEDVADALVYALSTPEHVQVHELIIRPVGEP